MCCLSDAFYIMQLIIYGMFLQSVSIKPSLNISSRGVDSPSFNSVDFSDPDSLSPEHRQVKEAERKD